MREIKGTILEMEVAMAMHEFKFESDGVDPEQFFRDLAPMQLVGAIHQVISSLSMPGRAHEATALPATVEGILVEECSWLQRAIGNVVDLKTVTQHIAGKLGDGLDLEKIPAVGGFLDGARLNMRNALFFCWMALPGPRRTGAEAERIVRLAIGRQLALVEAIRQELTANEV
jgi:hypothetical protein